MNGINNSFKCRVNTFTAGIVLKITIQSNDYYRFYITMLYKTLDQ